MRKFISLSAMLAILALWIATRPSPAAPLDEKAAAPDGPQYVIKPGVGIKGLEVGMTRNAVAEFLKIKDDGKDDTFGHIPYRGLNVFFKEGRVSTLIFNYREKGTWPFDGATDKGIGRASTVHDVIRKYGEPDWGRVPKVILEPSRRDPQIALTYPDLGTAFVFTDVGDIAYIRVVAPEQAPKK